MSNFVARFAGLATLALAALPAAALGVHAHAGAQPPAAVRMAQLGPAAAPAPTTIAR